ncbi:hypothetical protein TTRE_0000679901 [Trichuris trichiura]|uniref:Uncharacterized protein n=1 Tax=Trichuris trichiura TaxID=36087 RepID=A0A077ZDN7_TRITR|nr:hypothetical protein TTRE_0000679901 [Trichuris trichiura]
MPLQEELLELQSNVELKGRLSQGRQQFWLHKGVPELYPGVWDVVKKVTDLSSPIESSLARMKYRYGLSDKETYSAASSQTRRSLSAIKLDRAQHRQASSAVDEPCSFSILEKQFSVINRVLYVDSPPEVRAATSKNVKSGLLRHLNNGDLSYCSLCTDASDAYQRRNAAHLETVGCSGNCFQVRAITLPAILSCPSLSLNLNMTRVRCCC